MSWRDSSIQAGATTRQPASLRSLCSSPPAWSYQQSSSSNPSPVRSCGRSQRSSTGSSGSLATFQPIRALRLLRLLRLMRLVQVSRKVFSLEGLRLAALLALLTTLAGGTAFASVEKGTSVDDGLYWAITTITTVGSHIEPHSTTGKLLTVMLVLVGAGFVAILTGAVAQRFMAHSTTMQEPQADTHATAQVALLHELRDLSERLRRIERALLIETDRDDRARSRYMPKLTEPNE
jgi:hypothetical protein